MSYIPVVLLMVIGATLGLILTNISRLVGPRLPNKRKDTPFECGVPPLYDAQRRFSVRFYLVAILFLMFDVETIFFFPFALVYRKYLEVGHYLIAGMAFFTFILVVGLYYEWRKGALEWD